MGLFKIDETDLLSCQSENASDYVIDVSRFDVICSQPVRAIFPVPAQMHKLSQNSGDKRPIGGVV